MRGIEVPPLGSPRDRVFRDYLDYEARLEAKKHEMFAMATTSSRSHDNANDARKWSTAVKSVFNSFVSLLFGMEPDEKSQEEQELIEFYERVVKPSKVIITKDRKGKLTATGIPFKV